MAIAPPKQHLGVAFWGRITNLLVLFAVIFPATSFANDLITGARFTEPTKRYAHGVLGDSIEYGALEITVEHDAAKGNLSRSAVQKRSVQLIRLPLNRVFEDLAPRLIDVTGDGAPEVVVVETQVNKGAQLAVYSAKGKKLAATPHIGQTHRWLAPIGAADVDGDGHIEIAYIDRPHLAKTLRLWRYKNGKLREVAALKGLTNHQIGWDFIASGLRDCGSNPEMVTADAGWKHIMATRYKNGKITARRIGAYKGPSSIVRALSCAK